MNNNLELIKDIGYPKDGVGFNSIVGDLTKEKFDTLRKNKVASLYISLLNEQKNVTNSTTQVKERLNYMARMEQTLEKMGENINSTQKDVALVKTFQPFWVDSSDIDIIAFDTDSLMQFGQQLESYGFNRKETTPTAYALKDPETGIVIDAQTDFSARHVIYFEAQTLSGGVKPQDVYGTSLPTVSLPKDLALITVHSLTEQMFTLKEFYSTISILERMDESDCEIYKSVISRNSASKAASTFLSLTSHLSKTVFERKIPHYSWLNYNFNIEHDREVEKLIDTGYELPHKYTGKTFAEFCIDKLGNNTFRKTLGRQALDFLNPLNLIYVAKKVRNRRTRDHYSRDY